MIKTEEEVKQLLNDVFESIDLSDANLVIVGRRWPKVDKTAEFMATYGLKHADVAGEIKKLSIKNYSYTDTDRNGKFPGELWFFGCIPDCIPHFNSEVYVKIKLRNKVICLSFHEAEHPISYPYR